MILRFIKFVGLTVLILSVIIVTFLAFGLYRPDLELNPIVKHVRHDENARYWGVRTSLIPSVFAVGDDLSLVEKKLKKSGFKLIPSTEYTRFYSERVFDSEILYQRGASNLACSITVSVFIVYGQDHQLVSAYGSQQEHGCL